MDGMLPSAGQVLPYFANNPFVIVLRLDLAVSFQYQERRMAKQYSAANSYHMYFQHSKDSRLAIIPISKRSPHQSQIKPAQHL
jgi:hypothetical protein